MLRAYLSRRRFVIEVTFATGFVDTYGLYDTRQEAQDALASRWATSPPDPHAKYADVSSARVRRRRGGEPGRPSGDLTGRHFVLV